jgi:F0F1-type ATP synthase delta subunit
MVSEASRPKQTTLVLPTSVITLANVSQLLRELDSVENKLLQLSVRSHDSPTVLPTIGKNLQLITELNTFNLLNENDRQTLKSLLGTLKQKAPRMSISFSSEPTSAFLEKLIVWLRQEINPNLLVNVGLQPSIGAGCIIRTTNKFFDLSLRQTFLDKRHLLLEQIIPDTSHAEAK